MAVGTEVERNRLTQVERLIGRYSGDAPGPMLVCVGGVHGNEPAGVLALRRVISKLDLERPAFRGDFVALAGNLTALAAHQRFVDKDLNRQWHRQRVEDLRGSPADALDDVEDVELCELDAAMRESFESARGDVYFMDLHTTSAEGPPFVVLADVLKNRAFAMQLVAPVVLGLEERIGGTVPGFVHELGHVTLGFEGGQHDDPAAVDHIEAAVWLALIAAEIVDPTDIPDAETFRRILVGASGNAPRVVEVRNRHAVSPDDDFTMEQGLINFQRVESGDLVARDERGSIRARERGYILMPLYQVQGDDGFFEVRAVRPFWLAVSHWLRRMRLDTFAHWLPGARRHPTRRNTLVVNPHVARWEVIEVFHLLGFRQGERDGEHFVFVRREAR